MYSPIVAVLCLFLSSLGLVAASPSPDVAARQLASITVPTALASPTSITTTNTVQTANGTMIETCVLTFTPVGQQIQEVQNCTLAVGGSQVSSMLVTASSTVSPTAAAAFVMPGTTIQVLPIGLGIYGGITAIGIFVVAFVTWERVQYRKTFRQQRMAESSLLASGYGLVTKRGFAKY
ncbi:hypothetical protein OG21DRAFT_225409 [Imleria badia]|nr:hypothetical protein OG21DRAFT_225409 [Imleria badia]